MVKKTNIKNSWTIAYCDFQELDYQYNCRGLLVTPELLDRLQEQTADRGCGTCEVTISQLGEPLLESYGSDPSVAALNEFVDQLNEEEDMI